MSSSSYSAKCAVAYKKASLHETPSSSSQGWRPNGRVQSANNVFWPSRNGFAPDTNRAWQHGQCRGRGHQDSSKHYLPFLLTVHPKPVGVRTLFHVVGILKVSPAGS
ncbi:hypothetical protein Pyn_11737 [Prunus yedoensis var. nudiflora]|uniref:Uncharacterized protein n=1 Tax=Prunus yedoensis var. nudiflora TaxID=2094558 RepID=A0A314UXD8_PRUYE|nr:hypothetical protein Pyn_11737 [Prunus yedoensis var. nudiflora]